MYVAVRNGLFLPEGLGVNFALGTFLESPELLVAFFSDVLMLDLGLAAAAFDNDDSTFLTTFGSTALVVFSVAFDFLSGSGVDLDLVDSFLSGFLIGFVFSSEGFPKQLYKLFCKARIVALFSLIQL